MLLKARAKVLGVNRRVDILVILIELLSFVNDKDGRYGDAIAEEDMKKRPVRKIYATC